MKSNVEGLGKAIANLVMESEGEMTKEIEKIGREKIFEMMESIPGSPTYQLETKLFVRFLCKNGLNLNKAGVIAYLNYLDHPSGRKPCAARTYNSKLSCVKDRIKYLFEHSPDFIDTVKRLELENFLNSLKTKAVNDDAIPKSKKLSPEEIDYLITGLRTTHTHIPGAKPISLMLEFMSVTGCRVSELIKVRKDEMKEIRKEKYYDVTLHGKGSKKHPVKDRINWVDSELVRRINKHFNGEVYLFEHTSKPYHRIYITNQIKRAGFEILGKDISAHVLRHSFVTNKLKEKKDIKAVSAYVGHARVSTTLQMYDQNRLEPKDVLKRKKGKE